MYTELNQKIAEAIGYTVRTQSLSDEYPAATVIVSPEGLELWYTERSSAHYKNENITLEELVKGSWRDLFDPDKQAEADESDWDGIPPDWCHDATAALRLLSYLTSDYEVSLKSNRQIKPGSTQWYCTLVHGEPAKCAGSGHHDFPDVAICEAWLTAMAIQQMGQVAK